jgi:hypothetical protein
VRRSITAPIRVKTANEFIAMAHVRSKTTGHFVGPHMQTAYVREMRETIRMLLTQLERPRPTLEDGTPNRYHVRLTRIAPGRVDSHDNLAASFKGVVDEIASWIGVDDGHARVRWSYEQMGCPLKMAALKIEVEDLAPGRDVVIERGNLPARITRSRQRGSDELAPPKPAPAAQVELVFRECWAVEPWAQDGSGEPVLTPLAIKGDAAPPSIRLRVPAAVFSGSASVRFAPGTTATFTRSLMRVEDRECWIYTTPDGPADSHETRSRRAP